MLKASDGHPSKSSRKTCHPHLDIDKSAGLTYNKSMPKPVIRIRRRRSLGGKIRQNWKFAVGMGTLCAVVAFGTAIATQGLESLMSRASLAMKAVEDPSKLSASEKDQIKKMVKTKGAKGTLDSLTPEQKEQAKQAFGGLSEDQKKKYREMYGK